LITCCPGSSLLAKEVAYILNHRIRNIGSERRFHLKKHQGAGTEQGISTWSWACGLPLSASAHHHRFSITEKQINFTFAQA
jgi:hypothetical protein